MKGSHRVIVESKKVKYDFSIKRNITIFTGNSGSGKTVLIDLIREYGRYGSDSGVLVSCDCRCLAIDNDDWERKIREASGCIIFIDEGNRFLTSKRFADLVKNSDNYFVIATREKLPTIPYSVQEIYGFRESGKFHEAKQKYNEIYHLYGEISEEDMIDPDAVITEDSNSGYEFFAELARQKGILCMSADGKSNIIKKLETFNMKNKGICLLIVDGAAFGPEIKDVMEYIHTFQNAVLYAPESFEWLLLSSDIFANKKINNILERPEEYIDSKKYMSWERFFTALLINQTKNDSVWAYSKKKLVPIYLSTKVSNAVKKKMPLVIWKNEVD